MQLAMVKMAGTLPPPSAYSLQNLILGILAEPFYYLQRLLYRAPKDMPAPVFILGGWRSGTSFLLEEMVQQLDAAAPCNTFTTCPQAGLILRPLLERCVPDLPNRFIDWMPASAKGPQEFDVALFRFCPELPNMQIGANVDFKLALDRFTAWQPTTAFKRLYRRIAQWVWIYDRKPGKPLILKTPALTLQIGMLLELWPDAKFVRIGRDEQTHTASLIKAVANFPGQFSPYAYTGDPVAGGKYCREIFEREWVKQRGLIPEGRLCEVTLEEMIEDRVATVGRIKAELAL